MIVQCSWLAHACKSAFGKPSQKISCRQSQSSTDQGGGFLFAKTSIYGSEHLPLLGIVVIDWMNEQKVGDRWTVLSCMSWEWNWDRGGRGGSIHTCTRCKCAPSALIPLLYTRLLWQLAAGLEHSWVKLELESCAAVTAAVHGYTVDLKGGVEVTRSAGSWTLIFCKGREWAEVKLRSECARAQLRILYFSTVFLSCISQVHCWTVIFCRGD